MQGAGNAALRSKAANQLAIYIVIQLWHEISLSNTIATDHETSCPSLHHNYIALTVVWAWVDKCGPYIYILYSAGSIGSV